MKTKKLTYKQRLLKEINQICKLIIPYFGDYTPNHKDVVAIFEKAIKYDPYDYKNVILESEHYAQINARNSIFLHQNRWINNFQNICNLFYINDVIKAPQNEALLSHSFFHFLNVSISSEAVLKSFACELDYGNYCNLIGCNRQLKNKGYQNGTVLFAILRIVSVMHDWGRRYKLVGKQDLTFRFDNFIQSITKHGTHIELIQFLVELSFELRNERKNNSKYPVLCSFIKHLIVIGDANDLGGERSIICLAEKCYSEPKQLEQIVKNELIRWNNSIAELKKLRTLIKSKSYLDCIFNDAIDRRNFCVNLIAKFDIKNLILVFPIFVFKSFLENIICLLIYLDKHSSDSHITNQILDVNPFKLYYIPYRELIPDIDEIISYTRNYRIKKSKNKKIKFYKNQEKTLKEANIQENRIFNILKSFKKDQKKINNLTIREWSKTKSDLYIMYNSLNCLVYEIYLTFGLENEKILNELDFVIIDQIWDVKKTKTWSVKEGADLNDFENWIREFPSGNYPDSGYFRYLEESEDIYWDFFDEIESDSMLSDSEESTSELNNDTKYKADFNDDELPF